MRRARRGRGRRAAAPARRSTASASPKTSHAHPASTGRSDARNSDGRFSAKRLTRPPLGAYSSTDDVRRCRPSSVCDQRKYGAIRVGRPDAHVGIDVQTVPRGRHAVQLVERAPQQHAQLGAVVEHFRRVLGGDLVAERGRPPAPRSPDRRRATGSAARDSRRPAAAPARRGESAGSTQRASAPAKTAAPTAGTNGTAWSAECRTALRPRALPGDTKT